MIKEFGNPKDNPSLLLRDDIWDEIRAIDTPGDLALFLWKIFTGEKYHKDKMTRVDFIRVFNELNAMSDKDEDYTEDDVGSIISNLNKRDLRAEAKSYIASVIQRYKKCEYHIHDIDMLLNGSTISSELAHDLTQQFSVRTPLHRLYFLNKIIAFIKAIDFDIASNKQARDKLNQLLSEVKTIKERMRQDSDLMPEFDYFAELYKDFKMATEHPWLQGINDNKRRSTFLREELKNELVDMGVYTLARQREIIDLILKNNIDKDIVLDIIRRVLDKEDRLDGLNIKPLRGFKDYYRIRLANKDGAEYRIVYKSTRDGRELQAVGTREYLKSYKRLR